MNTITDPPPVVMPWGMHRGRPPSEVDGEYLTWFLRTCKPSPGVRHAIEQELRARGIEPPPAPAPQPVPPCPRHRAAGITYRWDHFRGGRRVIRAFCAECQRFIRFAPQVEPYLSLATEGTPS